MLFKDQNTVGVKTMKYPHKVKTMTYPYKVRMMVLEL